MTSLGSFGGAKLATSASPPSSSSHTPPPSIVLPWKTNLFWLEIYAWLFYLLLAGILAFSTISYLQPLSVGLYFGPQALVPVSYIAVVLFAGPPPFSMEQTMRVRWKVHSTYSIVVGVLSVLDSTAFIVVQVIYLFSSKCTHNAVARDTICNNHYGPFVFLLAMVLAQIVVTCLSVTTIVLACVAASRYGSEKLDKE